MTDTVAGTPARLGSGALLVTPGLAGHRGTYCRVIAGALAEIGYRSTVVTSRPRAESEPDVVELPERNEGPEGRLRGLAALMQEHDADVTILLEADEFIDSLVARDHGAGPELPGRLLGLFIRSTNYAYAARRPPWRGLAARALRGDTSPTGAMRRFHERLLERGRAIDAALVLDECFAAEHRGSHIWQPDIYRDFDPPAPEELEETRVWARTLDDFLAAQGERPVVVYVGTNQERRGYDDLLELALEVGGCFIHCGRLDEEDPSFASVSRPLRERLAGRDALLETRVSYRRAETADLFLRATRAVVLPYRGHDGSSGIMLQAAAAGRPVLVPDRGLMAWRARQFRLGRTFPDGDLHAMRREFRALLEEERDTTVAPGRAYAGCFSAADVTASLRLAVTGNGPGAPLPQERLSVAPVSRTVASRRVGA